MLKRRTLFVVGAGASKEIGMPIGKELAEDIGRRLDFHFDAGQRDPRFGDAAIFGAVKRFAGQKSPDYLDAAKVISAGIRYAASIDQFIDIHNANAPLVSMAKMAIVRAILSSEHTSALFVDRGDAGKEAIVAQSWLPRLFTILSNGVRQPEKVFSQASFIVFNYDRCLELFLTRGLSELYNIHEQAAIELLARARIYHPYGRVGRLPGWPGYNVSFGEVELDNLETAADSIKTFTEEYADQEQRDLMRLEVRDAERIVFLGFSFHEQSMTLLKPINPGERNDIFSTAYGSSLAMIEEWQKDLENFSRAKSYSLRIQYGWSCRQLMDEFFVTFQR